MLVTLALLASACSSSTPVGQVGATLSAMNGTVTLDKVLSPAPVAIGSLGASLGHKLVAVVLTVHSPTASPAKFTAIYINSKLVDSNKLAHIGKSTAKYRVYDCVAYPPFSTVAAGQTATGCLVFMVPIAATPVELKITGKASADWKIAATAVQAGTGPPPVATTTPSTVPRTEGTGTTTTIVGATPTTTAAPGTEAAGGTTTTSATRATTSTTTAKGSGSPAPHAHRHAVTRIPRIVTVTPRGAAAGTRVQILGRRLGGVTEVAFNGVAADIKKDMPGRIVVVVPEGATDGPVTVTTPSGTITSPRSFVVL